jgi:hypothetical protein
MNNKQLIIFWAVMVIMCFALSSCGFNYRYFLEKGEYTTDN